MKQLGLTRFAEFGAVLSTRDLGREAADRIQDAIGMSGLVIGFEGVEVATPSFLDEVILRVSAILRGNESSIVVMSGLNDDIRLSLELIATRRDVQLAVLEDDQIELIGASKQLEETLRAAQKLGRFRAPELAEDLAIKLPNLHQRLGALLEAGAVTRAPDSSAKRGRSHTYEAPRPRELVQR